MRKGDPDFTLSARKSLANTGEPMKVRKSVDAEKGESQTMWTDLYRPVEMEDLVGNEGVVDQLLEWLRDWDDVVIHGNKKHVAFRFGASWKDVVNPNARAALLSGPPGIGKTSAARLVCRLLGYEVIETNASDTRNKAAIA